MVFAASSGLTLSRSHYLLNALSEPGYMVGFDGKQK